MLLTTKANHGPHVFQSQDGRTLAGQTSWLFGTLPYFVPFKVLLEREALSDEGCAHTGLKLKRAGLWKPACKQNLGLQALHSLDTRKDSWGPLRTTSLCIKCLGPCLSQSKCSGMPASHRQGHGLRAAMGTWSTAYVERLSQEEGTKINEGCLSQRQTTWANEGSRR